MLIVFFRLFSADLELYLHRHILLQKGLAIAFFLVFVNFEGKIHNLELFSFQKMYGL